MENEEDNDMETTIQVLGCGANMYQICGSCCGVPLQELIPRVPGSS